MPILLLHFVAGLLAGALFRIQTLLLLTLLVLVEAVSWTTISGANFHAFLWVVAEVALQVGYLGGIFLRSLLERSGFAAFFYFGRRS
jgi:hypothetical protein